MEKFERKITDKIYSFNNAKEWSDLITIVRELNIILQKNEQEDHFNLSLLKEKISLSKRLAQCLNPSLPGGVHEVTLRSYEMILDNIIKYKENDKSLGEDLPLYASGLFPFFQNATAQNKQKYLNDIIKSKFLQLNATELELILPGLLASIIPALEEQNDTNTKLIKDIFANLREKVTPSTFYGCLWSIIIRNPHLRQASLKYLLEIVPSYKTFEELPENERKEFKDTYFPKMSTLIINSLCVVIEDQDLQTRRNAMDFLIKIFPINCDNSLLLDSQKIILIKSALKLLVSNEYSTTRRLTQWMIGSSSSADEIEIENEEIKVLLKVTIAALKDFFHSDKCSKNALLSNLKITNTLLNQLIVLSDPIMEKISYDMILCIVSYWNKSLNESENAYKDEIVSKAKNFFNSDENFMKILWKSLGENLILLFNMMDNKEKFSKLKLTNVVDKVIKPLKFCLLYIDLKSNENKVQFYIPIISHLLKILNNFEATSRTSFQEIKQIIIIILVFAKSLQEKTEEEYKTEIPAVVGRCSIFMAVTNQLPSDYGDTFQNLNELVKTKFYIAKESTLDYITRTQSGRDIVNIFAENILSYQKYYITILNQLLSISQNDELSRTEMKIFQQATEIMIRIQEYAQQNEVPDWVIFLEKCSFCKNVKLSLEASRYLLDLMMIDFKGEVYLKIKECFNSQNIDDSIIEKETLLQLMKVTDNKPIFSSILMVYLWNMLNVVANQKSVIDLLITYSKINMKSFINIISNTFTNNNFDNNVDAIKKFTQFWKLTNEFYPEMIFFENGEGIFTMLEFLEDDHPLLRHLSKSWLNQSIPQIDKILDPILSILFSKEISWELGDDQKVYFNKEYNTKIVIDAFLKLKNIIINSTGAVVKILEKKICNKNIIDKDEFGNSLEHSLPNFMPRTNYLELLINVSLRFIQGQVLEEISPLFARENDSVNAASCEFLEFLLGFIEQKSDLMKIAKYITEPVFEILHERIEKNDEVMQLQLLNLLKILVIDTKDEHVNPQFREDAITMVSNRTMLNCLEKGIQNNNFFIRGYFISFMEGCLPIFSQILDEATINGTTFCLIRITSYFLAGRVKSYKNISCTSSHIFSQYNSQNDKFIIKNYLEEYKEAKILDENDLLIIVKGLKSIIFHFLNINKPVTPQSADWGNVRETIQVNTSRYSLANLLSFATKDEPSKLKEEKSIIKSIYSGQLEDILSSFLVVWTNQSGDYHSKDYCLNDNGILAYYEKQENKLDDINIDEERKSELKEMIIEISLNMFIKDPVDFINHLLCLWMNKSENNFISNNQESKLSIIELLCEMNIPFNLLLLTIYKYIIQNQNKSSYIKNKSKSLLVSLSERSFESKISHFLYSYIILAKTENRSTVNYIEIWAAMTNVLDVLLNNTKIAYSLCWIYEILNIMLIKYPISTTTPEPNIKKNLLILCEKINKRLTDIAFSNSFESIYEQDVKLPLPILPSLYSNVVMEIYPNDNPYIKRDSEVIKIKENRSDLKENDIYGSDVDNNKENSSKEKDALENEKENINNSFVDNNTQLKLKGEVNKFYKKYHQTILDNKEINAKLMMSYSRKIVFLTLKYNYHSIIDNLYKDKPNEMIKIVNMLLSRLIVMMQTSQSKKNNTDFYTELSTEFIQILISNCPKITSHAGKQPLMDYFNGDSFFKTTPKIIRLWKDIIRKLSEYYPEIIADLMNLMDKGFFIFKNNENQIIKSLRRISFVIYSCEKDTFSHKLSVFKEKVKDFFVSYSEVPIIESEIFLMIRVLFLRFSHDGIMDMIRSLWPIILSELLLIINQKKKVNNISLLMESFKFIELLSLANIKEFLLYQWIFIVDTFDTEKLSTKDEKSLMNRIKQSSYINSFRPIAMNCCENWGDEDENIEGKKKAKKELILTTKGINSKEGMEKLLKEFFYSIGDMNNYPVTVNYEQIEKVIEADFIEG